MPAIRLSAMRTDLELAVVSGMLQAATGLKCLKDSKSLTNKLSLDILDDSGWCKNLCSQNISRFISPIFLIQKMQSDFGSGNSSETYSKSSCPGGVL